MTTTLIQYLGSTLVLGRPHFVRTISNKNDVTTGLRDYFSELSLRRHKRHLPMMSRDVSNAILGKTINHRHLQRIKRDLSSNPCYKPNSLKSIRLNDNTPTYSVECLDSTTTGCFHNVPIYTTTLCAKSYKYFPRTDETKVQGCSCA